jgi:PhnB protein
MTQATIPYLTVKGASEASAFYQKAFGATENARMAEEGGKRLLHVDLSIKGGSVFLCDEFPEHGGSAPKEGDRVPVSVVIALATPADVDAVHKQAVGAGAKSTMEPADTFWGARFSMLSDPFGHNWMLNAPLPQK